MSSCFVPITLRVTSGFVSSWQNSWAIAQYLGLEANYFQLLPKWLDNTSASCGHMDECPWHLDPHDITMWLSLLRELLRDRGNGLLARSSHAKLTIRTDEEVEETLRRTRVVQV